jgi:hypothetical protein
MESATISQAVRMERPDFDSSISRFAQVIAAMFAYTPEPIPSHSMYVVYSMVRSQTIASPQTI